MPRPNKQGRDRRSARSVPVPMNPAVKTAYNRIIRALKHLTPENQKRVLRATCILMDIPMPATLTA